jgi:hypothetical protein
MREFLNKKVKSRKLLNHFLTVTLLCTFCGSLASLPFFAIGEDRKVGCCGGEMPVTHDSWMHFNQMQSFAEGLASGRLYPRWDETTHGYGAPTTSFYPPGVYYLTSAAYFLGGDWRWAWVGFYWLTSTAAALSCYWYARQRLSRAGASLAMFLYVFAPYHLINQYQRGAMGEFFGFVWVPLVLGFADRLLGNKDQASGVRDALSDLTGLAVSFGALLWTHPPTAYQLLLVFGPWTAIAALRRRRWGRMAFVVGGLVLGSMLAGAYFYPAIVEQGLVNYDDVERTWPYHASYVFDYSQTVYDRSANPFFSRIDQIWVFNLTIICLSAAVAWRRSGRDRNEGRQQAFDPMSWRWIAAGVWASFLMTRFSAPLGDLIPMIHTGVFSWRMLTLTSLAAALLAGALADLRLPDFSGPRAALWKYSIPVVAAVCTVGLSFWIVVWPVLRGQAFEPNPDHYNFATLPRGASRETPPMEKVQTRSGSGRISIDRWSPEFRQLRIDADVDDQLQFRTLNFPGWTATMDDQAVPIKNGEAQNIVIDLPPGSHRISLEFKPTPIRRFGQWSTIVSFGLVILLTVLRKL